MNYSVLSHVVENDEEDAILAGNSGYLERIGVSFDTGNLLPLNDILLPIEISIEIASLRGRMTDYLLLDNVNCGIISDLTKELLEEKNYTNFQTLPIRLIDPFSNTNAVEEAKLQEKKLEYKEVIYENYSILNVTGLLDCIDHQASILEYFSTPVEIAEDMTIEMKTLIEEENKTDNDIDFIRKLVLDESKIPDDIKIFRLKDCPRILVFKEEIVKAIREAALTGFVFIPLSEYTDEIPDDDENNDSNKTNEFDENLGRKSNQLNAVGQKTDSNAPIKIKNIRRN